MCLCVVAKGLSLRNLSVAKVQIQSCPSSLNLTAVGPPCVVEMIQPLVKSLQILSCFIIEFSKLLKRTTIKLNKHGTFIIFYKGIFVRRIPNSLLNVNKKIKLDVSVAKWFVNILLLK